MTPEERIRMMQQHMSAPDSLGRRALGLDGTPVPDPHMDFSHPVIHPRQGMPIATFYEDGQRYKHDGPIPDGSTPMTKPEDWETHYSSEPPKPPSNRERIAAAHQKRFAQQRAMGR